MKSKHIRRIRLSGHNSLLGFYAVNLNDSGVSFYPIYRAKVVASLNCARHSRLASNEFFGRNYDFGLPAWDLRYFYQTIPITNFRAQIDAGEITRGDLIGIWHKNSPEDKYVDSSGQKRKYTHIGLFLGIDWDKRILFGEQLDKKVQVVDVEEIEKRGDKLIEAIKDKRRAA